MGSEMCIRDRVRREGVTLDDGTTGWKKTSTVVYPGGKREITVEWPNGEKEVKIEEPAENTTEETNNNDEPEKDNLPWDSLTKRLHKLVRSEEQEQTYCKARSKVRFIFLRLLRSCVVVFVLNFQRYQVRIIYSPLFENSSTYNIWTTTLLHQ